MQTSNLVCSDINKHFVQHRLTHIILFLSALLLAHPLSEHTDNKIEAPVLDRDTTVSHTGM